MAVIIDEGNDRECPIEMERMAKERGGEVENGGGTCSNSDVNEI
jgi:hypothetical protein